MENVNITLTEEKQCPLSARNATGPVTVKLEGNNKLETTNTSSDQCPALWAPVTTGVELIIMEGEAEGSLTAKGAQDAPGIGSKGTQGSQITIKSGKITATGGNMGAGIGGGYMGAGGTITITGSSTKVTANGGDKSDAAGIGCGKAGDGGTITITGGTVTATNGNNTGTGIPDIKGNTVVVGPDANVGAGCDAPLDCSYSNGFVFKDNNGNKEAEMQGTATLLADMTIGENEELTIPEGKSLTIGENVTLTNDKGTITNNGTITNEGTITNNGTIKNAGKINGEVSGGGSLLTKLKEEMIEIEPVSYTYTGTAVEPTVTVKSSDNTDYTQGADYTLDCANNTDAGTATVKVIPTNQTNGKLYGEAVSMTFTITPKALTDNMATLSSTAYTYDGNKPTISVKDGDASLTESTDYTVTWPDNAAGAGTHTVTITGQGNYTSSIEKSYTIAKATPTIEAITVPNKTYDGGAIVITPPAVTGAGLTSVTATLAYKEKDVADATYVADAPKDAGSYTVKASYPGDDNHNAAEKTADFTIEKATPTTPTGLTATYGQTLADVTLPEGWEWKEPTTTSVGDVGTRMFPAKYTPTDENYNEVENVEVSITVSPAEAELSFDQPTLTITQRDAVPANALTKPDDCTVTYTSSEPTVATVVAETGEVTVVGVGTTTITATAGGNYTGSASYTLTVNAYIPLYIPPTPDPDPVYYTVTIPTEVTGAIIHGGGTHEVEEYTYCSLRIELDPNGSGEYPTVTKGYWWDTVTPDGQGNYSFRVTGDTQITIGEVPTHAYHTYQLAFPTDSVVEADDQYWSGDYIEVTGASPLRAAEEAVTRYQAPFGTTVTLRPIETERRKFLMWEDGSKQKNRTLTFRADQEIKALWKRISPTGIEAIAAGSVIRGERGQLYIEVPEACDVTLYTYSGVPVRVARLAAGANRLSNLNAGLYLVKIGGAPAVPVRVR